VAPDDDGRVARITVDSRTSVPHAVAFLSSEYGSPEPELSRLRAAGPVDVTVWSWIVRDQNLKTVDTPRITLEPKLRLSQRKDEYASYIEIVFSH
jgi:hypothetical protein